jgi:hypothetical protein
MIGRGPTLCDVEELTQLLNDPGLKISPLITVQTLGYPIVDKDPFPQNFGNSGGLLVFCGKCEGIAGVMVGNHKNIASVTIVWLYAKEVHTEELHGS